MSTRRHQRSQARREQIVAELVASDMAEFQDHLHQARYFLVVSSVEAELARDRDRRNTSLDDFKETYARIESLIRDDQWQPLLEFVRGLDPQAGVIVADSPEMIEARLTEFWQRFGALGIGVGFSAVWLAEPRIYYLFSGKTDCGQQR